MPLGKQRRRREVVAASAPKPNKDRLWVLDRDGGECHLVHTGANVSLEMALAYDRQHACQGTPLTAANGSMIATYGERTRSNRFWFKTSWTFVVADVDFNIVGADFLAQPRRLVDAETLECIRVDRLDAAVDGAIGAHRASVAEVSHFSKILNDFPTITKLMTSTSTLPVYQSAASVVDYLRNASSSQRRSLRTWRLSASSDAPTARGRRLHIAPKPGGGWCPCGDYRRLNCVTKDDAYPVPTMRDFTAHLVRK